MNPLFPSPSAGFDDPLEMLAACHERIRRNCAAIGRIASHLRSHGPDEDARTAAAGVIRYFDTAGVDHHRDEEEDLFPALQHVMRPGELNVALDLISRLTAEHKRLDALWQPMRESLVAVAEGRGGGPTGLAASEFEAAYARHIDVEEAELLPLARHVLDAARLRAMGARMAERRGVKPKAV